MHDSPRIYVPLAPGRGQAIAPTMLRSRLVGRSSIVGAMACPRPVGADAALPATSKFGMNHVFKNHSKLRNHHILYSHRIVQSIIEFVGLIHSIGSEYIHRLGYRVWIHGAVWVAVDSCADTKGELAGC